MRLDANNTTAPVRQRKEQPMAVLSWDVIGLRFFESGIDRGVLYPAGGVGVPWNGLKGVSERASGGSPRPFYSDGYKYLNLTSSEEYAATIDAFSAPAEFNSADGIASIRNGLYITQQRRKSFGFSYRTLVGNDSEGLGYGYKIHLIYNALASATSKSYQSMGSSVDPMTLSWEITTTPPLLSGYTPTAHFIIDSRMTPALLLAQIEAMLYGSTASDPRLPSVSELITLMSTWKPPVDSFVVATTLTDEYTATGNAVVLGADGEFTIAHDRVTTFDDGSFTIEY
jgi:hypothetical protein